MKQYFIKLDSIISKDDKEYIDLIKVLNKYNLEILEEPIWNEDYKTYQITIKGSKESIIDYLLNDYKIDEDELLDYKKNIYEISNN